MFGLFPCKHDWKTIAIDERFQWSSTDKFTKEKTDSGSHIVRYIECSRCKERDMAYDDPREDIREFAKNRHDNIASARTQWIHGSMIDPNGSKIRWVDTSRAPLRGFENWLLRLKNDPTMKQMLSNQMVDDALGQLEVAVKLHVNNQPKDPE